MCYISDSTSSIPSSHLHKKAMKSILIIFSLTLILLMQSSCNSSNKKMVLQQCMTLGDESILYARANYVKLFHEINPEKFHDSYKKVKNFNHLAHRNTINTYDIAVRKLKVKDPVSKSLLQACKNLSDFSKNLADQAYPQAISFKNKSKLSPLTDKFFLEINKIVKFDHSIGKYNKYFISFKVHVKNYERAVKKYAKKFKVELPENQN